MSEFRSNLALSVFDYDVITLVETGLDASISENELKFLKYRHYRIDRDLVKTGKERGGGVIICIKENIWSKSISNSDFGLEYIIVQLKFGHTSLMLTCVYLPTFTGQTSFDV